MTTSALSSPSLGSASLMDWPSGPFSPDPSGGPRLVVQKQVVKVKGVKSEASVVLYYKLAVPTTAITQTFQLFSDEGITLNSSQVFPITGSKVISPGASRQLQKAAEVLGIGQATTDSSALKDNQVSQESQGPSRMRKAKITTSNFHVSLVVPPEADRLTTQKGDDRSHYIAVVQLTVSFALTPPRWPYVVRLPLARCLNNYLYFSVDESCGLESISVDFDPQLIPKPSPMAGSKAKARSDIEAVEANGDASEDQTICGPFPSTSSLCIRWAPADAGIDKDHIHDHGRGHRLVRAEVLHVAAIFSHFNRINDNVAQISVLAQLSLKGIHYPGLDPTAKVNLQLEGSSGSCWRPETVSIIPTKQSASSFRSFSTTPSASTSVHSLKPGSSIQARAQHIRSPSPQSSSTDSSDELLDADATLDDEGNLLDVRPPKGITSSSIYSSSDSEDEKNTANTLATTNGKTRRHSLGLRTSAKTSTRLDSSKIEAPSEYDGMLYVVLSTAALSEGRKEFSCTLEATIQVPIHRVRTHADGMRVTLPLIKASGIALEYAATAQGASYQTSSLGRGVQRNGIDAKRCVALSANPTPAEVHDARLEVLAEEKVDIVTPVTRDTQEPSREDLGSESDEDFAKRSFQGKEQGQTAQVDSLSGMIQQASVEVYSVAALQEDMLLAEGVKRKVKTTHVVRSCWPSAPAPSSSDVCGALLPQMVFAIPCSDESELQVLCASVNGHSVHIEENAAGYTRSSSSRIIDLQLPKSLKGAAKVDVFLLFVQESSNCSNLCLFPPVASSIADLSITLQYGAFESQIPTLSFSNQPVSLYDYTSEDLNKKQLKAHMVPSMTSVKAKFDAKIMPICLPATPEAGPLRRPDIGKGAASRRRISLFSFGHLFHALCTILLAILLVATVHTLDPIVDSLTSKVDQLALALNIDFTDGYWMPEPKPIVESAPIDRTLSQPRTDAVSHEESILDRTLISHLPPTSSPDEPSEPSDLSVDTTSFALLMQSLSVAVTTTLTWPIRFLFAILGRSS